MSPLPQIPVLTDTKSPREIFDRNRGTADALLGACYRLYTRPGLALADIQSKKWLARVKPRYGDDIEYFARQMGRAGLYTLNLSFEWGCTTMAFNDPAEGGVRLYRAMDWPIKDMADKLVVGKCEGPAGTYWNITYPGFAGVLNGLAPGRFAITINQAPVPKKGGGFVGDWLAARKDMFASYGMPAPLLLRKVFEECSTYKEAVEMLATTPLCIPALFTVAGTEPGEHCVIERMHRDVRIHEETACIANNWLNEDWKGHDRPEKSRERHAAMAAGKATFKGDFDWLVPPVMNDKTRLAFEANPRTGSLRLVAIERQKAATQILNL